VRRLEGEWQGGKVLYVEALSPGGRAFGQRWGLRLTPSFVLFDANGRLVHVWTGAMEIPGAEELERRLRDPVAPN
jgi:hypothetical protein